MSPQVRPRAVLRAAAILSDSQVREAWGAALAERPGASALPALLEDWGGFSGLDYPSMLTRILSAQERIDEEWQALRPSDPQGVAGFYDSTETVIPLLLWWHGTDLNPARCAVAAARVFEATGARRVLDFGCGIGSTGIVLARAGLQVTLAEVARKPLEFAVWRLRKRGLDADAANLLEIPVADLGPETFEGIVAFDVFEHVPELDATLEELDALLPLGGTVLFNQAFVPADDELQHYPRCGESVAWFHAHGYRLAHVRSICWIAQKARLGAWERVGQRLELQTRVGIARALRNWRGPVGRRIAYHAIRYALR